jgi:hypothetical protein
MEHLTKSAILQKVVYALDHSEGLELQVILKKTSQEINISMTFREQEVYIDEKGQKWVRE